MPLIPTLYTPYPLEAISLLEKIRVSLALKILYQSVKHCNLNEVFHGLVLRGAIFRIYPDRVPDTRLEMKSGNNVFFNL